MVGFLVWLFLCFLNPKWIREGVSGRWIYFNAAMALTASAVLQISLAIMR
jgi:hypothetical protein